MALPWEPPSPSLVPKKKATKLSPYNPMAYVPGGAPANVAQAIQSQGFADPGPTPIYVPRTTTAPKIDTSGLGADFTDTGVVDKYTPPQLYEPNMVTKSREWTPDEMQQMIMADPMYGIGQGRLQEALDRGYSTIVRSPTQQAVRGFGALDFTQVPEDIRGQIEQLVGPAAANEDPLSTMAQLRTQLARGNAALPYRLAARGATRSGAAKVLGRRLNEGFASSSSQALKDLLGVLSGLQSQYSTFSEGQKSAWDTLREQITSRLAQKPGPTWQEAAGPPPLAPGLPSSGLEGAAAIKQLQDEMGPPPSAADLPYVRQAADSARQALLDNFVDFNLNLGVSPEVDQLYDEMGPPPTAAQAPAVRNVAEQVRQTLLKSPSLGNLGVKTGTKKKGKK